MAYNFYAIPSDSPLWQRGARGDFIEIPVSDMAKIFLWSRRRQGKDKILKETR